ncbi:hypothetical protein OAA91_02175 [Fibrobacterales bacterium]|nr:hypothetical protein [Fibrobacterales bacterium]
MTKIWNEAFWKTLPVEEKSVLPLTSYFVPIGLLASLTLIIGLSAEPLIQLSAQAAEQLLNPTDYLKAVQLKKEGL